MRITSPDWVGLDYATHESASIDPTIIIQARLPGLHPTMSVQELGSHPAMLDLLDARMVNQSKLSDWTARLWAVVPFARKAIPEGHALGWRWAHPNELMGDLLASWRAVLQHQISAIVLTWVCARVPRVERLVDLRGTSVVIQSERAPKKLSVMGQLLPIRRYQHADEPPIEAAYSHTTRTLFRIA